MAWGPGVPEGRNLYDLNPSFESPADSRPGYGGKQPIRNADLANVVTDASTCPVSQAPSSTIPLTCLNEPIGANGVHIP